MERGNGIIKVCRSSVKDRGDTECPRPIEKRSRWISLSVVLDRIFIIDNRRNVVERRLESHWREFSFICFQVTERTRYMWACIYQAKGDIVVITSTIILNVSWEQAVPIRRMSTTIGPVSFLLVCVSASYAPSFAFYPPLDLSLCRVAAPIVLNRLLIGPRSS